jgi:ubiquitin C-terminal hydrolase
VFPHDITKSQRRAQLAALRDTNRPYLNWQAQLDTLYRLDIQCTDTCRTCDSVSNPPNEETRMLSLGVNIADTTIYDAVSRSFSETMTGVYCSECETNRTKDRVRYILAAPKVLVVHLQILTPVSKVYHALTYPENLDLTARQTHTTLPLRYRLTGVVSHGGNGIEGGHYIASVRQRVPGDYMCISDDNREDFNLQEFTTNPQRPTQPNMLPRKRGYQVYMCMYEREDGGRRMPRAQGRMTKELRALGMV